MKIELKQMWKVKIMVIIVVESAPGVIADRLSGWLTQTPETNSEVELQKRAFLGTSQVLRHVLRLPAFR